MYRLLFTLCLVFFSCSEHEPLVKKSNVPLLNGLYEFEAMDSGYKQIWIFSDNTLYRLYRALGKYADERLGISHGASTKFFIRENLLYNCGLNDDNSPISISKCLKENELPSYRIISVDTLYDGYNKRQVVILEDAEFDNKYELQKVFYDTINREINVKLDIFDVIDDARQSKQ